MIGRRLSHYKIIGKLGEGGMGEVYLAEDLSLGRRVALKVLPTALARDPERLQRLQREARALAALDHPNIVTVFSVEEVEDVRFLTMAYVEGRTLAETIRPQGLPLDQLLALAIQLADALRAAHGRGIVHRDLKPGNVMVDGEGRVRILDFGLAKREPGAALSIDSQLATEAATAAGMVLGTFPYMSPEQAEGKAVDARSDIFSLGAVLYEMATGERPFTGDSALTVLSSIVKDTPAPVTALRADLPRHLGRVIEHCLAKNPERRYQSVQDVRNELEALSKEAEIGSAVSASASRLAARRERRWVLSAAIAGAVLVAGVAYWATSRARPPAVVADDETAITSVLALPSEVFGAGGEEYLTDAVPRSLSTHLAKLPGLEIKAPPTRLEVDRIGGDLDRIADLYGVGAWVRSAITAEPDRFVLNVQLVDVASRSLLWSEEFEGARGAYLDLVREAADAVGGWLRPEHGPRQPVAEPSSAGSELALRRGQFFSSRYNNMHDPADFEAAREAFEELLRLEPDSAEAAVELGWLHLFRFEAGEADALTEIERWGSRAVEADAKSGLGWSALAFAEAHGGFQDRQQALVYGLRAAAAEPASGRVPNSLGYVLDSGGFSSELGLEAYREAAAIDPIYAYAHSNTAFVLLLLGRFEQALPFFESALKIRPEDVWSQLSKWCVLSELGRAPEASAAWARLLEIEPGGGPATLIGQLLQGLAGTGEAREKAAEGLRELLDSSMLSEWQAGQLAESVYPLAARHGAADLAFELIDRSLATGRAPTYDSLALSPLFDPIREERRFEVALAAARVRFDLLLAALDTARHRGEVPRYLEATLADLLARLKAAGYLEAAAA